MQNVSFPNIGSRFGTDEASINLVGISVYNVETDFLNYLYDILGTTNPNWNAKLVLLGSSIAQNTNKIDNIVGVSLYNDDLRISQIGTTISVIDGKVATLGVSINSLGVSYSGLQTLGVSHLNLINMLGTSSSNLETNKIDKTLIGITINSLGTSFSGIVSMGIS